MICICRTFTFEAAHHLPNYKGKCSRPHGHGFKLEVEVSGRINEKDVSEKGMIMDFGILKKMVNDYIIDQVDHTYLNDKMKNPTAENTVMEIKGILSEHIASTDFHINLERIRLYETENSYAEWRRDL